MATEVKTVTRKSASGVASARRCPREVAGLFLFDDVLHEERLQAEAGVAGVQGFHG